MSLEKKGRVFVINKERFSYDQIREKIIALVTGRELTAKEIAAELGTTYDRIKNIVPAMAEKNTIQSNGRRCGCKYYLTKPCALQSLLRPLPEAFMNLSGTIYNEVTTKHNLRFKVPYESYGVLAHYQND